VDRHLVVVVGAGFAGLGLAIQLRRQGIDDFVVLERGEQLGGVWRDNVYPGVACDIPAHLYSYSFEPNPDWSRFFAPQREILAYLERCADKYDVRSKIRTREGVTSAAWDEAQRRWILTTSRGRTIEARAVVCAAGIALSRPTLPKIPGIDSFEGRLFHSARWDANAELDGKSIGVIGTGASAIQIVPEIAPKASRLYVFQRTPPWVMARPDQPIPPKTRDLLRRRPIVQKVARTSLYWLLEGLGTGFVLDHRVQRLRERFARKFLAKSVPDETLRAKLTPNYLLGCKRVLFSNDWYPTLLRPNVEVVTDPIGAVDGRAIVTADGARRDLDVLVCATGFEAAEATLPFELRGRAGRTIATSGDDGLLAYLGTTVPGFPNFFFIVGPNTGLGHNSMIFMMESQYPYVLGALRVLASGDVQALDVKVERARRYNERLQSRLAKSVWNTGGCASWYRTASGVNTTLWPGYTWEFRLRTRRFDREAYDHDP
jgi:cation diffusion facilitator CzcD-associated flavoprotein CzcO